jgi:hypothetical protein
VDALKRVRQHVVGDGSADRLAGVAVEPEMNAGEDPRIYYFVER